MPVIFCVPPWRAQPLLQSWPSHAHHSNIHDDLALVPITHSVLASTKLCTTAVHTQVFCHEALLLAAAAKEHSPRTCQSLCHELYLLIQATAAHMLYAWDQGVRSSKRMVLPKGKRGAGEWMLLVQHLRQHSPDIAENKSVQVVS
jgi:hypothetical protein